MKNQLAPFAHLHLHTDNSFLDGVGRSAEYVELARQWGHKAMAITDHGNLYGLPEHKRQCEAAGIKPIYGCEVYVNDARATDAGKHFKKDPSLDPTFTDNHLVLLCESDAGWKNLLRVNHDSVKNGYYRKPRTDHQFVIDHNEGLIATTACLGSQFGQFALRGQIQDLRKLLGRFKDAFGDRFFYEIHVNELPEQKTVNGILIDQCRRLGIEPLLTCDVHYACAQDTLHQDEMIACSRRTALSDPDAFRISARHLWFADSCQIAEQSRAFGMGLDRALLTRAIANTALVGDRCNANIYTPGQLRPPNYIDDDGDIVPDPDAELVRQTKAGLAALAARIPAARRSEYARRVAHELAIIKRCNMAPFYLVTADVTRFCRQQGIMVWTRGSGCASLVAAAIGITPIDPIRFGLLFERFVDPSRAGAPDFDLDIDTNRRAEVVRWLYEKYGGPNHEHIARICALTTFGIKGAIRDLCFAHSISPKQAFDLSAVTDKIDPTYEGALADCSIADRPDLHQRVFDEIVKADGGKNADVLANHPEVIRSALTMVGRARGRTLHAAGFVVSPEPLVNLIPVDRATEGGKGEGQIATSWGEGQASQDITDTGLMKLDLLGLIGCAVVSRAVQDIKLTTGVDITHDINPWNMDFTDARVLLELGSGNGMGLHQLAEASQSLAHFVQRLCPRSVDELIAAVALYRPGSIEFIDEFIGRARGQREIEPVHPVYDRLTAGTYGILVYQEQIMQVLHEMGGVPLRGAYDIIKAISKKKKDKIHAARQAFEQHAGPKGKPVFDMIEKFAGYGFNKCVAGTTRLSLANGKYITVLDAYRAFRSKTALGKKMRSGRWRVLQMDDDGRVRPGVVGDVILNGERKLLHINTSDGPSIAVTDNHRLLTDRGYIEAGQLKIGDKLVAVDNEPQPVYRKRGTRTPGTYTGCGFPSSNQNPMWVDGRTALLRHAKIAVDSRIGGRGCERCGSTTGRLEYAHTLSLNDCGGDMVRYHSAGNIRMLCNPCHKRFDYSKGERVPAWTRGKPTRLVTIDAIRQTTTQPVFDLVMETKGHNFLADGIVSHNSHAASYGVLSWITAYLRAYYPTQFWKAWLDHTDNTAAKGDERKISQIIRAAAGSGVRLLPPRVGKSSHEWQYEGGADEGDPIALRAPLSLVLGVGELSAKFIHAEHKAGRWKDWRGFLAWCETHKRTLNGRQLQSLARSGAMDSLGVTTEQAADITRAFTEFKATKRDGTQAEQTIEAVEAGTVYITRTSADIRTAYESSALGFNFWQSPWNTPARIRAMSHLLAEGKIVEDNERSLRGRRRAFMVTGIRKHRDRKGKEMAFLSLQTRTGSAVRGVVFASVWSKMQESLAEGVIYLIAGEYERDGGYMVAPRERPAIPLDMVSVSGTQ